MAHKPHHALRSGLYSGLSVLPGESRAAFKKLHQQLILEYRPDGASETDLVHDIARLTWRKRNLVTYRLAYCARRFRHSVIEQRVGEHSVVPHLPKEVEAEAKREEQAREEAEQEVREELGPDGRLLELDITGKALRKELDLFDKFDALIARRIKQLLLIKGMKQVAQLYPAVAKVPQLEAPSRLASREPNALTQPTPRGLAQGNGSFSYR
jgi:hypothetical protein